MEDAIHAAGETITLALTWLANGGLAAFGIISPVIVAVAMATSSLLVVGNSLRLRG